MKSQNVLEQKQSESKKFTLTTTFARKKKKNLFKNKKLSKANPISRLLLSSQEEANEVRHKQFLHVPVTDRFAIL